MVQNAFFEIRIGKQQQQQQQQQPLLRLDLILYDDDVPKTVRNFVHYLSEHNNNNNNNNNSNSNTSSGGYRNSCFHRIIPGFMAQGGDFVKGDGTGSASIYGESFPDENFRHRHDRPGVLSMANSGRDTNGSQFFVTFRPTPHLDGRHVVFGRVDLSKPEARDALRALETVRTDGTNDRPVAPVEIVDCGIVNDDDDHDDKHKRNHDHKNKNRNENENKLDERTTSQDTQQSSSNTANGPAEDEKEVELSEEQQEDEDDEEPPKTRAEALRQRMRKLKMKMNQARRLNQKEVLKEGERLGSAEGAARARRRQKLADRARDKRTHAERHSHAVAVAVGIAQGNANMNDANINMDHKHLLEQADSSLERARTMEQKQVAREFGVNDYHNPEGMHRNYERNLRSLRRAAGPLPMESDNENENGNLYATKTFDPILDESDEKRERAGARNLANELRRRIEKQKEKNKRNRLEFEGEDVTWINQRNKRFNQKISRNFDKHTAEIKQNLERGTAL